MAAVAGGKLFVQGCTFEGNHADRGGGLGVMYGVSAVDGVGKWAEAYVADSVFRDTHSTFYGAGVYNLGSLVKIERSSFVQLSVGALGCAGALWSISGWEPFVPLQAPAEVHLSHVIFDACTTGNGGGAMGLNDLNKQANHLLVMRNVIVNNSYAGNTGGGVWVWACMCMCMCM